MKTVHKHLAGLMSAGLSLSLLLGAMVPVSAAPTDTGAGQEAAPKAYYNDFAPDADMSGMTLIKDTNNSGDPTAEFKLGTDEFWPGYLYPERNMDVDAWPQPYAVVNEVYGDFVFETSVRKEDADGQLWLQMRKTDEDVNYQQPGSGFSIWLDVAGGNVQLWVDGTHIAGDANQPGGVNETWNNALKAALEKAEQVADKGHFNQFRIAAEGNKYEVYVNGDKILEYTDTREEPLLEGKAAFMANRAKNIMIDYVRVTPIVDAAEVTSVENPAAIVVDAGTKAEDLKLPATVKATDTAGAVHDLAVTWDTSAYKADTAGDYTITGTLTLPEDGTLLNTAGVKAEVKVTVLPAYEKEIYFNDFEVGADMSGMKLINDERGSGFVLNGNDFWPGNLNTVNKDTSDASYWPKAFAVVDKEYRDFTFETRSRQEFGQMWYQVRKTVDDAVYDQPGSGFSVLIDDEFMNVWVYLNGTPIVNDQNLNQDWNNALRTAVAKAEDRYSTIKIVAEGNMYTVYVNGDKILEYVDEEDTLLQGSVALMSNKANNRLIDWVKVTPKGATEGGGGSTNTGVELPVLPLLAVVVSGGVLTMVVGIDRKRKKSR